MTLTNKSLLLLSIIFNLVINFSVGAEETIGAGELLLKTTQGTLPSILLKSHAEVDIQGMSASVSLTQSFQNNSDQWVEGKYLFPLFENAVVDDMEIQIGERIIKGEIKEKKQAIKIYHAARKAGKIAVLTQQHRPNLFTQKIANIPPHETIKVTLHYFQLVRYVDNHFEWKLPTTLTPRYFVSTNRRTIVNPNSSKGPSKLNEPYNHNMVESNKGWGFLSKSPIKEYESENTALKSAFISGVNKTQGINTISINIKLDPGLKLADISSPYHKISITNHANYHQISLSHHNELMDRDFKLSWRPVASEFPQSAVFTEQVDNQKFAVLMTLPPQNINASQTLSRDIVFIIDTSGSMGGRSIREAKASLIQALQLLSVNDRFNIVEFNTHYQTLFSQLKYSNPQNIQLAKGWVRQLKAQGGTEMYPALNWSFEQFKHQPSEQRLSQIVFITDGAINNETQLLTLIHTKLNQSRLFTVGIGSAPNGYFMRKSAQFGRGTYTHIGTESEVSKKMNRLFNKLNSAVATQIKIDWPVNSEFYPQQIPDLYVGEPLIVATKLDDLSGSVEVGGNIQGQYWQQTLSLSKATSTHQNGISAIWAHKKIAVLEDKKIQGADPDSIKKQITEIALRHHLISKYTAFVAVDETELKPKQAVLKKSLIPALTPQGSTMKTINYPQTASGLKLWLWLGILSLLLLMLLRFGNIQVKG